MLWTVVWAHAGPVPPSPLSQRHDFIRARGLVATLLPGVPFSSRGMVTPGQTTYDDVDDAPAAGDDDAFTDWCDMFVGYYGGAVLLSGLEVVDDEPVRLVDMSQPIALSKLFPDGGGYYFDLGFDDDVVFAVYGNGRCIRAVCGANDGAICTLSRPA